MEEEPLLYQSSRIGTATWTRPENQFLSRPWGLRRLKMRTGTIIRTTVSITINHNILEDSSLSGSLVRAKEA
jgi:hypothetical protein